MVSLPVYRGIAQHVAVLTGPLSWRTDDPPCMSPRAPGIFLGRRRHRTDRLPALVRRVDRWSWLPLQSPPLGGLPSGQLETVLGGHGEGYRRHRRFNDLQVGPSRLPYRKLVRRWLAHWRNGLARQSVPARQQVPGTRTTRIRQTPIWRLQRSTNVAAIPVTPITPHVGAPQHGVTSIQRLRNGKIRRIACRMPMRSSYPRSGGGIGAAATERQEARAGRLKESFDLLDDLHAGRCDDPSCPSAVAALEALG